MRLHKLAIDEKLPLVEASKAEEIVNQPVTVQQTFTATAIVIRERLVRMYCLRF